MNAIVPQLSALFRNGSDASVATAMTLLLQRPDAHLPLMTSGDVRVCVPAIDATIDLFESLGPETLNELRTFDIAHLEELYPSYVGKISGVLERLAKAPVRHHDALTSFARQRQSEGGYPVAVSFYREAMEVVHPDHSIDRLFHATAIFRTTTSAEQREEVNSELRDIRNDLLGWETGRARGLAYAALAQWSAADVHMTDGQGLYASACEEAARATLKKLSGISGHVGALNQMATRALRAGLWCLGLMKSAGALDETALKPMMVRIVNDECTRFLRLNNISNAAKIYFEMGLSSHARGDLVVALKRYKGAYDLTSESKSKRTKDWRRTIAVLIAVCEAEIKQGASDRLKARIQDQIHALKGDPEHATLVRWLKAIQDRF